MLKSIIGQKIGMTQLFDDKGKLIPVTVISASENFVTQVKTQDVEGYDAIQVAYGEIRDKLVNKPLKGHFNKAGVSVRRHLKELRFSEDKSSEYPIGTGIRVDIFAEGDKIDVIGISKGKGFQGTIKRWNARRGPMSHGSKFHRAVGSMGASSSPSRTFKNKKMPGRMGNSKCTTLNLEIVKIIPDKELILIKGAVPGHKKSIVQIRDSIKK